MYRVAKHAHCLHLKEILDYVSVFERDAAVLLAPFSRQDEHREIFILDTRQ